METVSSDCIKLVFADANGASWVDCHNQPDTLWTITQVDDNYRIAVGDSNANYNPTLYPNVYYGVRHSDASESTPVVYWNLTPDEAYVDWAFVTPEQYAAYT